MYFEVMCMYENQRWQFTVLRLFYGFFDLRIYGRKLKSRKTVKKPLKKPDFPIKIGKFKKKSRKKNYSSQIGVTFTEFQPLYWEPKGSKIGIKQCDKNLDFFPSALCSKDMQYEIYGIYGFTVRKWLIFTIYGRK